MTKRITTDDADSHHWKVRVVFPGAIVHLASSTKPEVEHLDDGGRYVWADWLDDPECGDSVGWIDWSQAIAVTWRHTATR